MYSNVFIVCDGSLTIDVMGFLRRMETTTKNSVIWTGGGAGALIVFLKSLGFTYDQITENLVDLECLTSLMFGGSVDASSDIKEDLEDWFKFIFQKKKKLFKEDITLNDIYGMTRIFPNFIVYDDSIKSLNPVSHPDYKLVDCVMASLTNYGSLDYHIIDDTKYTSFSIYDPFPMEHNFELKDPTTLYIANYSIPTDKPMTYIERIENSLKKVHFDRVMYRIGDIKLIALVNGFLHTFEVDEYSKEKSLENGATHAQMFLNGEDVKNKMIEMIDRVKNQS